MTKNVNDILTIATKRTALQPALFLLLGQEAEKKEKANPHSTHLVLPHPQTKTPQNQKSVIFANTLSTSNFQYGNK